MFHFQIAKNNPLIRQISVIRHYNIGSPLPPFGGGGGAGAGSDPAFQKSSISLKIELSGIHQLSGEGWCAASRKASFPKTSGFRARLTSGKTFLS